MQFATLFLFYQRFHNPIGGYNIQTQIIMFVDKIRVGWMDFTSFEKVFQSYQADWRIILKCYIQWKSSEENPQKLTQLSPRSHPRRLEGKRTARKDALKNITSDSQANGYFPYRWSPASRLV